MKKILSVLAVVLILVIVTSNHKHNHKQVIINKNDTAYVVVGKLLKPYEVANLLVNQL
jgi:lipopolysaccharide export system protein LptC